MGAMPGPLISRDDCSWQDREEREKEEGEKRGCLFVHAGFYRDFVPADCNADWVAADEDAYNISFR